MHETPNHSPSFIKEISLLVEQFSDAYKKEMGQLPAIIHCLLTISNEKLANALAIHALSPNTKVFLLYDNTIFGSGEDGFLITESAIHFKNSWDAKHTIRFADLHSILFSVENSNFIEQMVLNDEFVIEVNRINALSFFIPAMANLLQDIVNVTQPAPKNIVKYDCGTLEPKIIDIFENLYQSDGITKIINFSSNTDALMPVSSTYLYHPSSEYLRHLACKVANRNGIEVECSSLNFLNRVNEVLYAPITCFIKKIASETPVLPERIELFIVYNDKTQLFVNRVGSAFVKREDLVVKLLSTQEYDALQLNTRQANRLFFFVLDSTDRSESRKRLCSGQTMLPIVDRHVATWEESPVEVFEIRYEANQALVIGHANDLFALNMRCALLKFFTTHFCEWVEVMCAS